MTMALQVLVILQVILILLAPALLAYPVYGTKRYGSRSLANPEEYDLYYKQTYPDDDYYPVYYPARTSKYEVYQAVLPYYFTNDPVDQDESIGHETYYENNQDLDDVNAAFLHNLIMSQMYDNNNDIYGKWEESTSDSQLKTNQKEDEDVRELKQLVKQPDKEDIHWFRKDHFRNQEKKSEKLTERKPITIKATKAPSPPSQLPRNTRGQKEEVLMRPATPVRHPFSQSVLDNMNKRSRSVYDTIKHLLNAERNSGNEFSVKKNKRFITNEENLARQLSVLKKTK